MPYTVGNTTSFHAAHNSSWFEPSSVREILNQSRRCDYSVIESRRELHQDLNQFMARSREGRTIFSISNRFSATACYYTDYDAEFSRILTNLGSVLSWRSSAQAKDEDSKTGSGASGKNQFQNDKNDVTYAQRQNTQEAQDNSKRFEELVNALAAIIRNGDFVWVQETFEYRLSLKWEGPSAGKPPTKRPTPGPKPPKLTVFKDSNGNSFVLVDGILNQVVEDSFEIEDVDDDDISVLNN